MNAEHRRFPTGSGHKRSQQFRFRSHDTNFGISNLDALSEGAQVIPPIAASFHPQPVAGGAGEIRHHFRRDSLIAGTVERRLTALCVGRGLIPDCLEASHALLQHRIAQVSQTGFNGVVEAIEPLIGFRDSPVQFR
ncbi:hypothetical protein [Paracoccus kondratievae]|uniref:hypothetical protein n=1 Tax=Paracoccus kondratievae TaxID=135740 RepID=UPI0022F24B53|nr:hypothetical protein [Paracoccus kondratievae]